MKLSLSLSELMAFSLLGLLYKHLWLFLFFLGFSLFQKNFAALITDFLLRKFRKFLSCYSLCPVRGCRSSTVQLCPQFLRVFLDQFLNIIYLEANGLCYTTMSSATGSTEGSASSKCLSCIILSHVFFYSCLTVLRKALLQDFSINSTQERML